MGLFDHVQAHPAVYAIIGIVGGWLAPRLGELLPKALSSLWRIVRADATADAAERVAAVNLAIVETQQETDRIGQLLGQVERRDAEIGKLRDRLDAQEAAHHAAELVWVERNAELQRAMLDQQYECSAKVQAMVAESNAKLEAMEQRLEKWRADVREWIDAEFELRNHRQLPAALLEGDGDHEP